MRHQFAATDYSHHLVEANVTTTALTGRRPMKLSGARRAEHDNPLLTMRMMAVILIVRGQMYCAPAASGVQRPGMEESFG
jgi:hypothetical protein